MTFLVERLAELRKHVDHLHEVRPRVTGREALERDLSLHNDVLFSLLMISQLVVDIAGELSARRGLRFETYTEAVRNLAKDQRFPADTVDALERLPGFRNVLVHEYVSLDMDRVIEALENLEPVQTFIITVSMIEKEHA
jgi:uncharacterized protein YutE (UPF0331/DUF86 family)